MNENKSSVSSKFNDLKSITVGEILYAIEQFKNIFEHQLKKNSENFSNIPLKVVIKRLSNNKVVDLIGIRRVEMNKEGSYIWFVCSVNKSDSIFIHNNEIVKLKLSTKSINEISDALNHFKKVFEHSLRIESKLFYDLPVKIVIMNGIEENDEEFVDTLDIATVLMNDVGSGIFCHSLIDDLKMIRDNPNYKKLLDESENKYANLMQRLSLN